MPKIDERIAALEAKLKQLKVRQQRAEARAKSLQLKQDRKADTRRKILAGAILLAKVENGLFDKKIFNGWMDAALTREDDRALFGLPTR
jgi:hypothetical protein